MSSLLDQLNSQAESVDRHHQDMIAASNQAISGFDHTKLQEQALDQGYKQAKGLALQLGSQAAGRDIESAVEQFAFAAPAIAKTGKYLYKTGLTGARQQLDQAGQAAADRLTAGFGKLRSQASELGGRAQDALTNLQSRASMRGQIQLPAEAQTATDTLVAGRPPPGALSEPGASVLADVGARPQVSETPSAVSQQPLGRFAQASEFDESRFADPVGEGGFLSLRDRETGNPVSFEQQFPEPPRTFQTGSLSEDADFGIKNRRAAPFRGALEPTEEQKASLLYERQPAPLNRTPAEGRLPPSDIKAGVDPDLREASLPETAPQPAPTKPSLVDEPVT